ncbi:DUF2884 family protein [Pseudomonas sp. CGJS7]|uniref:DUF2884 family protein n=1 Tax=Pseudomonas sp. CGJS7 TaxID=3109348 RepID=UPI00300A0C22
MRASLLFRTTALAALTLACGSALAEVKVDSTCEIDSPYELTLNQRSLILTRKSGAPKAIVMRQGRMFVDDRWVALSADDTRRIAEFERGTRAAMPEAQHIGREAADIAFTALGEVAAVLGNHPDRTRTHVEKARKQLDARLAHVVTPTHFSGKALGDGIGEALADTLPTVMGELVGGSVTAVFSGDLDRFKRLDAVDAKIDAAVQPRADALGRRADALCERVRGLDELDNALAYRFAGKPLELVKVEIKPKTQQAAR